ncbi:MAG: OadG family protein [Halioglobus sp.]|nr:OadG family protein [Halioglobus sp.]
MTGDIVAQGIELMIYGMGTVLVFLTALVFATSFMSWCLGRFMPAPAAAPAASQAPRAADDAHLVAVISAAIRRYREDHK